MVKVKKRASKRVKIAQREKIKKKVKEHRRKTRRDERRSTQWKSKARKDPGIPNSFPYKEQLLNEIEQKRRIQEEEKLARKAEKLAQRDGEEAAEEDGEDAGDDDDDDDDDDVLAEIPLTAPLYRGTLSELLGSDGIKTVVLALDARDPQSFRSPWLEAQISSQKGKKLAFALSRADMVPLETVTAWSAYLSTSTGVPVFPISSPSDQLVDNTGAEALVEQLDLKGVKKGDVAVLGLSHSGRSTVADAILNAIGVPEDQDAEDEDNGTSDWPAVLDTPALVPLKSSEAAEGSDAEEDQEDEEEEENDEHKLMARMELKSMQTLMRNQGHVQRIKEPLPLAWALMSRVSHPEDLMLIYNVPAFGSFQPDRASLADEQLDAEEQEKIKAAPRRQKVHADTQEFLIALARATGRMKKRNIPDEVGASRVLLRDWSHQMLGYYTQAPKLAADAQKVADEIKQRVSTTLPLVLARKEWRKKFQARELRLRPISLVLGREALVLDQVEMLPPPPEQDSEEDEDEDEIDEALLEEGEDSWEDEEEEDEDDKEEQAASKKAPQLKSILKKNASKKRDLDAETAEDDEEEDAQDDDEAAQPLSRKDRRLQKKARVVVPSKSKSAAAASKSNGSKASKAAAGAAKAASAATGPAPGEKYDFAAFF